MLARLRLIRERKALTQQQLADKANVNRVTVARLERGSDQPFPTTVRKLADALGVKPDELMGPPSSLGPWGRTLTAVDLPEVERVLREYPELATLVSEAADQLTKVIPDARFSLEVLADPEYEDDEQLFLGVSTGLQDSEAIEALRRFDLEWWVDHARLGGGLLCIDLN